MWEHRSSDGGGPCRDGGASRDDPRPHPGGGGDQEWLQLHDRSAVVHLPMRDGHPSGVQRGSVTPKVVGEPQRLAKVTSSTG